ncbi:MAG: hypothetical protein ACREOQ_19295 [Gemmatimonadales bacterium]
MCGPALRRESLYLLLAAALPARSAESRLVVRALVDSGGRVGNACAFAAALGMGSRFRVARLLRREALPQLEELAAWVRVLGWILWSQEAPVALERIAMSEGLEASVCCRTVRRLTGATWTEARARGPAWLLALLAARCGALAERRAGAGTPVVRWAEHSAWRRA